MSRIIRVGSLLTVLFCAVIISASAFAQGSYSHHRWCLQVGGGLECAYNTLSQCRASASGRSLAGCVPNSPTLNHR
jgi:hypothetical protein